jgi:hypothetical protein
MVTSYQQGINEIKNTEIQQAVLWLPLIHFIAFFDTPAVYQKSRRGHSSINSDREKQR